MFSSLRHNDKTDTEVMVIATGCVGMIYGMQDKK